MLGTNFSALWTSKARRSNFLLITKPGKAAALRFLEKAMKSNEVPEKVLMDKGGANKAVMDAINAPGEIKIVIRQVTYLNNLVERDHRGIKRITRATLNFK